ncbi:helix-turn-helix transcriptional regulator [Providencia stuartii]|uniref:Transcriptional regulator n=2 Tax=Providencia TaxID=586 RepID=A0A1S1HUS7_PROST|nr:MULTISPECIES: helix-turn-helix transcriptional regulator [Providencia]MDV5225090.1 helix-turn-helix transcriptional regulator [Providencia rettgeri]ELR5041636.1 helix-turn-helix transcriptional regulator [Providencia stuartii]ELR5083212.1 helix-turn-helix transcriptional regulator [Providencia stuartii]ELR5111623.1 helix-turn-helix transcriptional regulator [Providencia stuartii]ELR5299187.1 helix-turn-helix transcriptional regulator [Providencia stuartii]
MTKNKELLRKEIGSFLKKARKNQSLTGHQLGRLMQVSQQQISRYERGESGINIETLDVMLDILGKSWSEFFFSVMINYSDDMMEMRIQERKHFL